MTTQKRRYELKARAESQRRTRERIVEAAVALHQEVGPAKTTVAELARRAGVQRLTVYNHFPEDIDLFGACQGRWMAINPMPDFSAALELDQPHERLRAVLEGLYGWYRSGAQLIEKVERDRGVVPSLDALMQGTVDPQVDDLGSALADGFHLRGRRAERVRAHVALALDFWTWSRLDREGLNDATAAQLMTDAIAASASTGRPGRNA